MADDEDPERKANFRNRFRVGEYWYRYSTRSWYKTTPTGSAWVPDEAVPAHIRAAPLVEATSLSSTPKLS